MVVGLQFTRQPLTTPGRASDVRKLSATPDDIVPRPRKSSAVRRRTDQTSTPTGLASSRWEFPPRTSSKHHGSIQLPLRDATQINLDKIWRLSQITLLTPESSSSYGGCVQSGLETPPSNSNLGLSNYIHVDDDDENFTGSHTKKSRVCGAQQPVTRERLPSQQPLLMDLTEDDSDVYSIQDYMTEEQFHGWISQQTEEEVRRTSARRLPSESKKQRAPSIRPMRNLPIATPLVELDSFHYMGMRLGPKVNVELNDGDFMRIVHVLQDTNNSDVTIRGWIFRRTREMNGVLPKKLNEVCWILAVDEDDFRDHKVQAMETIPIENVVKRRALKVTNQEFPMLSFRNEVEPEDIVARDRVLICRFKYTSFYPTSKAREGNNWSEKALVRLRMGESDLNCEIEDEAIRQAWRGDTIRGGAHAGMLPGKRKFLDRERHDSQGLRRRDSTHWPSGSGRRCSLASLVSELEEMGTSDPILKCEPNKSSDPPSPTVQAQGRRGRRDGGSKSMAKGRSAYPSRRVGTAEYIDLVEDDFGVARDFVALSQDLFTNHHQRCERTWKSNRVSSPDIVDIKAKFETSSRLGTFQREYTGQVKSTFNPLHSQPRKRTIDELHLPNPVSKRVNLPFDSSKKARGSASSPLARRFKPPPSPTDSDKTFDCSPSIDLVKEVDRALPSKHNVTLRPPTTLTSTLASLPQMPPNLLTPRGSRLPQTPTSQPQALRPSDPATSTQRYTVGDSFCGAGGMSHGCIMAGLRVEWGFDFNPHACRSYELNFYATRLYRIWAHEFSGLKEDHKVDILHLSPPCQFFSDAHTVEGKDDDMNIASLFAIYELLIKAKPRVVTLEQTSGLLRRHPIFMNAVIQMFTARGFSIRWRVLNCADFGLPQRRLRVFIIASW